RSSRGSAGGSGIDEPDQPGLGALDTSSYQMNWIRYSAVVMLALWAVFAPATANAQEIARVHYLSRASRPVLLTLPEAPQTIQQRRGWLTSAGIPADGDAAR